MIVLHVHHSEWHIHHPLGPLLLAPQVSPPSRSRQIEARTPQKFGLPRNRLILWRQCSFPYRSELRRRPLSVEIGESDCSDRRWRLPWDRLCHLG